ncbi:MAG: IS110 family transposase [Anaerolineaceae bacterium]|nr:IS110 family transposase [Anaerolineaceae bacterium]
MNEPRFAAYIGLDWGDQSHSVHLRTPGECKPESFQLEQKPEALHEWVAQLQERFHGRGIAVAIEQRKGAVIHALMMYDFFVLYPINPKALARYREAFHTSGAKGDPTDAELLLDFLMNHTNRLRAWVPDTQSTRKLQALCEQRRKMVNRRVALENRITSLLKQYFPQALDWIGDVVSIQACDFLESWPTLQAVQRIRKDKLRTFYHRHNCRKASVVEERIRQIACAWPLTTDPAIVEPYSLVVESSAAQMRILIRAIEQFDKHIAKLFALHPEHDLFDSFPGAGPVCGPRLLVAFGTDRTRWTSAVEIQSHSGIAPVTERSGNSSWIHHRLSCAKFVKQTFHEFADQSIRYSTWARAFYDLQRSRGKDHHAALRSLAYKWIRIIFRCWKDEKPYDEKLYLESLRRSGSPLLGKLS